MKLKKVLRIESICEKKSDELFWEENFHASNWNAQACTHVCVCVCGANDLANVAFLSPI
jgi:hypothetical protein